tara:strand:- start:13176 stop:15251 length:2076 start_codon:yes stop_codon:yes gene_type:complete
MASKRRWPAIIAALVGFAMMLAALSLELAALLTSRGFDFIKASNGDLADAECVEWMGVSEFEYRWDPEKPRPPGGNVLCTWPLYLFCPTYVKCNDADINSDMRKLAMAMTHVLEYSVVKKTADGDDVPDDLIKLRDATREITLGRAASVDNFTWYNGLKHSIAPPKKCVDIYSGASYSYAVTPPWYELRTGELTIECLAAEPTAPSAPPSPSSPPAPSLPSSELDVLYTHCVDQHSYGRFKRDDGASEYGGTLGIPVYGNELMPEVNLGGIPSDLNSSVYYERRVRVLTGVRFGYDLWGFVPSIMLDCFLAIDCVFVFVTFWTLKERLNAQGRGIPASAGLVGLTLAIFKMYSTVNVKRKDRYFLGLFMWLGALVFRLLYSFAPWAAWSGAGTFPRPVCEGGGAGWQKDVATRVWMIFAIVAQIFTIGGVALGRSITIDYEVEFKSEEEQGILKPKFIPTMPGSTRTRLYTAVLALGSTVLYVGQGWAATVFGHEWALTVLQTSKTTWTTQQFGEAVMSKALGAIGIASSVGLVLACILARWVLAPGKSQTSCYIFLLWSAIAVVTFIPLLTIDGFKFMNRDEFSANCANLVDYSPEEVACRARYWFYLIGSLIVFLPIVLMVGAGLIRYSNVLCTPGFRARARIGPVGKSFVQDEADAQSRKGRDFQEAFLETRPLLGLKLDSLGTRRGR